MATTKYKKETAENKQQTQVPAPGEGGLEDKSKQTAQVGTGVPSTPPVKLTSGAVPPEKTQAGSVPTQVNQSIPEIPLQDRGMDTQFVQNPDDVIKGPVLEPQEGGIHSQEDWKDPNFKPPEEIGNPATTVRYLDKDEQPLTGGNPIKDRMKPSANTNTNTNTGTGANTGTVAGTAESGTEGQTPLFKSNPAMAQEFENEVKSWGLNGNVDHFNRPMVDAEKLRALNYNVPEGSTSVMVYPMRTTLGEVVLDENGQPVLDENGEQKMQNPHDFIMTPIGADGKVYGQKALGDYTLWLMQESGGDINKAIELDKQKAGLIVAVDAPEGIEDKIKASLQKYYVGEKKQEPQKDKKDVKVQTGVDGQKNTSTSTPQGTGTVTATDVAKDGKNVGGTPKIESKDGENLNDVKNTTSNTTTTSSVEDWKKSYSSFTRDQIETILSTNKGIEGQDPNLIKALEELYAEKGGNVETQAESGTTPSTTGKEKPKKPELTEEEKAAKKKAKQDLQDQYFESNKDLNKLPVVSEAKMVKEGWIEVSGKGNQVLHPQIVKIKDKNGKTHKVLMSPIMDNGEVLSPQQFKDYVKDLEDMELEDADEILSEDKDNGCGLIIKINANNDDLDNLDNLCADILKGEDATEMTSEEKSKKDEETDGVLDSYGGQLEMARGEIAKIRDRMNDPEKTYKSNLIETIEGNLKENKEKTERAKKSQKRRRLIANIGDFLQLTFNSLGAYLGANSAELTSLSAAVNADSEKELTKLEKQRLELQESLEKAKDKVDLSDAKDLERWQKYISDLNRDIMKYKSDKAKLYTQAELRDESKKKESKEQALRRVREAKIAKELKKYQHQLDLDKIAANTQGRLTVVKEQGAQRIAAEREHGAQARATKQTKPANSGGGGSSSKKKKKKTTHKGGRKSEGSWRP